MSTLVADIETNGFYVETEVIHCIATVDADTRESNLYTDIQKGLDKLTNADRVVFHNGAGFDVPVIQKLYPGFQCNLFDTLCLSRLLDPERQRHSIESYGKQFGDYKVVHEDWSVYTEAMGVRCVQDTLIGLKVYKYLMGKAGSWDWEEALKLEQEVATIHLHQVNAGVDIDIEYAKSVVAEIDEELGTIDPKLLHEIPKRYVSPYGVPVNKPFLKNGDYSAAVVKWFV